MRVRRIAALVAAVLVAAMVAAEVGAPSSPATAATPAAGTLGPGATSVSWSGTSNGPTGPAPFGEPVDNGAFCTEPGQCDEFALTVRSMPDPSLLDIVVSTDVIANDFDLHVFLGAQEVASSAQPATPPEEVLIPVDANAGDVVYRVVVNPYSAPAGTAYSGTAKLAKASDAEIAAVDSSAPPPAYVSYPAPSGLFDTHAEPTIGANHKSGNALFQQGVQTARVKFDDASSPPTASWKDVTALQTGIVTLDPILETDSATGRTVVTQLLGVCTAAAVTDDDGETWQPSTGCPQPHGADHQTLGGGPRRPNDPAPGAYPDAMYYCSQSVAGAFCGKSDDGGQTFGTTVPIYDRTQCANIHGQIEVAPDGTVYVPNQNCGGKAAVIVSEDGGSTWSIRPVPFSTANAQATDPGLAVASDGTLYLGYRSGEGNPLVAVSRDKGNTWTHPVNVGARLGLRNATFPVVTAGDGDRAAFAFLGTTTEGNPNESTFETDQAADNPRYTGPGWHLYVAHTYDRGQSWSTVDLTPTDPVQRGCLFHGGGDDPCRDLLDFNDVTMDGQGRVLIAYTDACLAKCVSSDAVADNVRTDTKGVIARLTAGKGLLAAYDGKIAPGTAPVVCGLTDPAGDAILAAGSSEPSLDLVDAGAGIAEDGSVRFVTKYSDLGPPPAPFTGATLGWTFAAENVPYELLATRSGSDPATLAVTRDGVDVANAGTAVFDDQADTVTITVRRDAFDPGVKESTELFGVALETRAITPAPVLAPRFDTAGAPCAFTLAGYSAGAAPGSTGVAPGRVPGSGSGTGGGSGGRPAPRRGTLPATGGGVSAAALVLLASGLAVRLVRRRAARAA